MKGETKEWLLKAWDDLRVLRHEMSLPPGERVVSAICFHAQQFVEKALKAFLIEHGKEFPRTHNISFLKRLCSEIDKDFDTLQVDELSLYAVESRYPGEPLEITDSECERCGELAEETRRFLEKKLGIEFEGLSRAGGEKGAGNA